MRARRHHNNSGAHQVTAGKTPAQIERIAERLGLRFKVGKIIRDYSVGAIEKYQPGGDAYIDQVSPGERENGNELLRAIQKGAE